MSLKDLMTLNVGRRIFQTTRVTLVSHPGSFLANMFSLDSSEAATVSPDGAFFIDADPDAFSVVLNWPRRKKLMMTARTTLENVAVEAEYFQLDDLKKEVEGRIKEIKQAEKKKVREKRENDEAKQEALEEISSSISSFRERFGRSY